MMKDYQVADFLSARSQTNRPPQWPSIAPPLTAVAGAMDYMLKRSPTFTRFLADGRICLTNNAAERALRGIALGRRNWTFAGSDRGADRAAAVYSLIETARLNDVDPRAWLADMLARINDHPAAKFDDLLPWIWRPLAAEPDLADRSSELKGPGNTEPDTVVPSLSPVPAAGGGAQILWMIAPDRNNTIRGSADCHPETTAGHTLNTIAAHPGTAIGGSSCIAIMPAIFDPFRDIPMNVVKTKAVRGIATNRFRFIAATGSSIRPETDTNPPIPPVEGSRRSRARHIFPLRLTQ